MSAPILDLETFREARLATATPFRCVHGEARPGLVVLHIPEGWPCIELTPAKARVWLDHLVTLIESAEALERESR